MRENRSSILIDSAESLCVNFPAARLAGILLHLCEGGYVVNNKIMYRLYFWRDVKAVEPPLVYIVSDGSGLSSVRLDDSVPGQRTDFAFNVYEIPSKDVGLYFDLYSEEIAPGELVEQFNLIQKFLIEKNLSMMGPIAYARVGWLMKYRALSCEEAIAKGEQVANWMRAWLRESVAPLLDGAVPDWGSGGRNPISY